MPPKIDLSKCAGCGSCVSVCPAAVLKLVKGKAKVAFPKKCLNCGACEAACPNGAIKLK